MRKMKIIRFCFFALISLPKTIYFNFKTLPFRTAIKLPVLIGWKARIVHAHKNVIRFDDNCTIMPFMVRIGFGGSESVLEKNKELVNIGTGSLKFGGRACFAAGSTLDVSGDLTIGSNFSTNKNAFISCSKKIDIGKDVMLGWNVVIFDASGHTVYHHGEPKMSQKPIMIGDHVWICSEAQLLKGAEIGNESIVGWGSIVTRACNAPNSLIVGIPAEIRQGDISWGRYIGK